MAIQVASVDALSTTERDILPKTEGISTVVVKYCSGRQEIYPQEYAQRNLLQVPIRILK